MLPNIEKIIYKTSKKLYLLFDDEVVRVIDIKSFSHLPDWQLKIITKNWQKAKITDGDLSFSPKLEMGADMVKKIAKEISKNDIVNIISSLPKKKLMQTFVSLLM